MVLAFFTGKKNLNFTPARQIFPTPKSFATLPRYQVRKDFVEGVFGDADTLQVYIRIFYRGVYCLS